MTCNFKRSIKSMAVLVRAFRRNLAREYWKWQGKLCRNTLRMTFCPKTIKTTSGSKVSFKTLVTKSRSRHATATMTRLSVWILCSNWLLIWLMSKALRVMSLKNAGCLTRFSRCSPWVPHRRVSTLIQSLKSLKKRPTNQLLQNARLKASYSAWKHLSMLCVLKETIKCPSARCSINVTNSSV